jgi:hypothetical protein
MIHRRTFLAVLASLIAFFSGARASHPPDRKTANMKQTPKLVLHKGWVLRSDDPRGS